MKILLVGNPNTGKSTLFNTITNSDTHTGNWHGVTVDEAVAKFKINNKEYEMVDLPGLYSLSPNSFEEKVSVDYILNNKNSPICFVCSNISLKRNLLLLLELLQLNRKVIVCVNQMDKTINFNLKKLQKLVNVPSILVNAKDKKSVEPLKQLFETNAFQFSNSFYLQKNLELENFKNTIKRGNIDINEYNFFCQKAYCGDEYYLNKLNVKKFKLKQNYLTSQMQEKYKIIDNLLKNCDYKQSKVVGKSAIDKFVLNKFLCIPIFLLIMSVIFYLTFFSVGQYFSNLLRWFLQEKIGTITVKFLSSHISVDWLIELVRVGIFGGVGTIISFLPQVVLLFVFLSILENSGYISRLAFCLDDTLKVVGLSGKSVYTLLMGFGCSTTACLTARNMTDKNAKIKTAMLAPYMSCSAKLPVYAVIGGAFFGAGNIIIIILLYILGVILAILISLFFEKSYLKSSEQTFLMEFPSYQKISLNSTIKVALQSSKNFLVRIGSLLFALSIVVWFLENFNFSFQYITPINGKSMLQNIGEFICPIFIPLGFSSWGTSSALLAGLVAKETIISAIAIFNNVNTQSDNFMENVSNSLTLPLSTVFFTPASALSFMVFCLLYSPCIATISVLRKEIGKKWTFISIILQFLIAYATSLIVYLVFRLSEMYGIFSVCVCIILLLIVCYSLFMAVYKKKHKTFKTCANCNKNCCFK